MSIPYFFLILKLIKDIKNVTSRMNRLQPNNSMAKMSIFGPKGIFSLTAQDILGNTAAGGGIAAAKVHTDQDL